jgi:hypothetical protein
LPHLFAVVFLVGGHQCAQPPVELLRSKLSTAALLLFYLPGSLPASALALRFFGKQFFASRQQNNRRKIHNSFS